MHGIKVGEPGRGQGDFGKGFYSRGNNHEFVDKYMPIPVHKNQENPGLPIFIRLHGAFDHDEILIIARNYFLCLGNISISVFHDFIYFIR